MFQKRLQVRLIKTLFLFCIASYTFILISSIFRLIDLDKRVINKFSEVQLQTDFFRETIDFMHSFDNISNAELNKEGIEPISEKIQEFLETETAALILDSEEKAELLSQQRTLEDAYGEGAPGSWHYYHKSLEEITQEMASWQKEAMELCDRQIAEMIAQRKTAIRHFVLCSIAYIGAFTIILVVFIKVKGILGGKKGG